MARRGRRGFTLLEVMVAVAILGLSLTVILSAQVGLFSSGTYAQHMSVAIGLSRCRMSELEEQFLKLGYPLVDTNDEGACCAGDTRQDMRCAWKIERIELPNATPPGLDGGTFAANPLGSSGLNLNGATMPTVGGTDPLASGGGLGPLGALAAIGTAPMGTLPGGTSGLSGMLAGAASGGTGALAPLVMGIVYPSLKPMLEESIRRVTVTVLWREGMAKRELELIQWVSNPVKGFLATAIGSDMPSGGFPLGGLGGGPAPAGGGPSPTPIGGGAR